MGSGGGDRLILADDEEHEDEIRMGTRDIGDFGGLGSISPPDVEDDDEDAEELLMRLQEQNERSWSRSILIPACPPPALMLLLSISEVSVPVWRAGAVHCRGRWCTLCGFRA